MTEIPAAIARRITARCGRHQCDLELVGWLDDRPGSVLDVWECPGILEDPERLAVIAALSAEAARGRQSRSRRVEGPEWERLCAEDQALIAACRDSWVLTIPS
jgi:hypothetical protein